MEGGELFDRIQRKGHFTERGTLEGDGKGRGGEGRGGEERGGGEEGGEGGKERERRRNNL